MIEAIYPGISHASVSHSSPTYFLQRTILSGRNDTVDDIDDTVLDRLPGNVVEFCGADRMIMEEGADLATVSYPTEYLNTLNAPGIPLSRLRLKIGCPLMILQNINPSNGLCNGTQGILTNCKRHILQVCLLGRDHHGKQVFIPRIKFKFPEETIGFHMEQKQFPVWLAFVMTINKSQGQSVKHIGIDLGNPVFTHGQLYAALSRCTSSANVKVLFDKDASTTVTSNIVYKDILLVSVPEP